MVGRSDPPIALLDGGWEGIVHGLDGVQRCLEGITHGKRIYTPTEAIEFKFDFAGFGIVQDVIAKVVIVESAGLIPGLEIQEFVQLFAFLLNNLTGHISVFFGVLRGLYSGRSIKELGHGTLPFLYSKKDPLSFFI